MLTVLIPTRNRSQLLSELLRKLESEDPGQVKVAISDNASEDPGYENIPAQCAKHPLNIQYQRHPTPIAAIDNFSSLNKFVTTEFACYLGDDDFWEPGALSEIVRIMQEDHLDFAYAKRWHLHDRETGVVLSTHEMHELHESVAANIREFLKYRNDPHTYGIVRSQLFLEMSKRLESKWKFVPQDFIFNTAYPALFHVFAKTTKIRWVNYAHSQGIAVPGEIGSMASSGLIRRIKRLLLRVWITTVYKPQLYWCYVRIMQDTNLHIISKSSIVLILIYQYLLRDPILRSLTVVKSNQVNRPQSDHH